MLSVLFLLDEVPQVSIRLFFRLLLSGLLHFTCWGLNALPAWQKTGDPLVATIIQSEHWDGVLIIRTTSYDEVFKLSFS